MSKTFKPGQKAPVSGIAEKLGPRGGKLPGDITIVKGHILPPAPKPGVTYKVIERTPHKRGK
jgi:hypothetical protein